VTTPDDVALDVGCDEGLIALVRRERRRLGRGLADCWTTIISLAVVVVDDTQPAATTRPTTSPRAARTLFSAGSCARSFSLQKT